MSDIDDILGRLDFTQLGQRLGADPAAVEHAARQALPTLLMGLDANAHDAAGAASIESALADHDPSLLSGGVDIDRVDAEDGAKITQHIFGAQRDDVLQQLGGLTGDSGLVRKLLPILAPIVMAWLASKFDERRKQPRETQGQAQPQSQGKPEPGKPYIKPVEHTSPEQPAPTQPQTQEQPQQQPSSGGSILTDILGQVLGGQQKQQSGGGILGDLLGSLLGGGRR